MNTLKFMAVVVLAILFPLQTYGESCYKIVVTDMNGNSYQVFHPEFTNNMKVRAGGLRFQKEQTSFVFKWSDVKKITNNGKTWAIEFNSGMADLFELGISMDILLGRIDSYGNKGEFQIYSRHVKEIRMLEEAEFTDKSNSESEPQPPVEIVMRNGKTLSGSFSQDYLFLDAEQNLVKVPVREIAEIKIHRLATSTQTLRNID